jgi:D-sedoheptulose 7-phosphate isomerase
VTAGPSAAVTDPPGQPGEAAGAGRTVAAFGRRIGPSRDLADRAGEIANAAHAMAVRFHQGGKLVVFGVGGAAADAQHVAVEFVHPVIVGKRALPAISLTSDAATVTGVAAHEGLASVFAHQIRYLAEPADIALGIALEENCPSVVAGLRAGSDRGMLTVALVAGTGSAVAGERLDHLLAAGSADPLIVKEIHVSTYHLLWELVHVFFEQPGVLGPGVVT